MCKSFVFVQLFRHAVLIVLSRFTFISLAVGGLCLFLIMLLVGLQCVIVVFPGHTHLLFVNAIVDHDQCPHRLAEIS